MKTEPKKESTVSSVRRKGVLSPHDGAQALDAAISDFWRNHMIKIKAARAARGE